MMLCMVSGIGNSEGNYACYDILSDLGTLVEA